MTTDLEQLAEALKRDTPEKLLKQKIADKQQEIADTLARGEDYVLDAERRLVIKRAS